MDSKVSFRPVQGSEEQIRGLGYNEGYLYFATDSKKIYLDANDIPKIPMGGNSGFYYGKVNFGQVDEGQTEFTFSIMDIEGNDTAERPVVPNINDLILNIPDGCFYRVREIITETDEPTLVTEKLTIAGSGGGGGGTSGEIGSFQLQAPQTERNMTVLAGSEVAIHFTAVAMDYNGIPTGDGYYDLRVNGVKRLSNVRAVQGENTIDVTQFLKNAQDTVAIQVIVYMDIGGSSFSSKSITYRITPTVMELIWNYNTDIVNYLDSSFTLEWSITGSSAIKRATKLYIDDQYEILLSSDITNANTQVKTFTDVELLAYNLFHGTHKFMLQGEADINGHLIKTNQIIKNIYFAERGNSIPIINCSYFDTTILQYNTAYIPIKVYSSGNYDGLDIDLRVDGELVDTWTRVQNNEERIWSYTPSTSGIKTLTIQCGLANEVAIVLDVQPLAIKNEEIKNYAFKFKASDFSSNTAVQNWNSQGVTATFSPNFDWINGGLSKTPEIDENGNPRQYFCIKSGSTMTINYKLFAKDARTSGKCFKFIFKATKCKDYDAQVLSCVGSDQRGLVVRAQNALFRSLGSSINVPYCEDQYIEFELDIHDNNQERRYIKPWLDGVPVGLKLYNSTNENFIVDNNITIGSPDCDVYVYLVKAYERTLSDSEHLANFIFDAPNAIEIYQRYIRNDILNERGEISYQKLAVANPDCYVHLYNIARMTKNKKDPIDNCHYEQFKGTDTASLTADGVTIKVQGTSSAAYGLAAYNLDSKFSQGFTDRDGNTSKNWAMSENSVPVNYFTTKVNVASSEGANNALNQEWYNRFQPYKTIVRCKNEKARDTMEFTPGVLFVQDNNPIVDSSEFISNNIFKETPGYVNSPYYKMYAVCNMGNSKKNVKAIHDTANPYECCIENTDNQKPNQNMYDTLGLYFTTETDSFGNQNEVAIDIPLVGDTLDGETLCQDGISRSNYELWLAAMQDESFEFRYPDGFDELNEIDPVIAERIVKNFYRFVHWMSRNNPQPKYKKLLNRRELKNAIDIEKKLYRMASDRTQYNVVEYNTIPAVSEIQEMFSGTLSQAEIAEKLAQLETQLLEDGDQALYIETVHTYGYTNLKLPNTEIYPSYTFKGYKVPTTTDDGIQLPVLNENGEHYQADYEPLIKGTTISKFAGNYNYDTYEYRMAKMLSECEDYLCMDSVLYHYLFIERHTMIDNVAKNTFWSTEDGGKVWNLTKNYDDDTADGNNNQGRLELTYGIEPGDLDIDGVSVFNAGDSVWLAFIKGLIDACQVVYQRLDEKGAWDPNTYLKMFKDWQDCIPERCWIEDYYRKYIRPYEVYGVRTYMEMLEGGKKTHQRAQYEIYQNYYISSKYFGSSASATRFHIRANGENLKQYRLPITLYANCYIKGAFGSGQTPNISIRAKRNQAINLQPPIDNATDATVYLWPANLYQTMGNETQDLGFLKPNTFEADDAKKLRTLSLYNYGSPLNQTLTGLALKNNEMLENLYVAKLGAAEIELDLTSAPNLKYLEARDSAFTGVTVADNAPLEVAELNGPTILKLSNLSYLKTLNFQNPGSILAADIDNIDESEVNSKIDILDKANNLTSYRFRNVKWTIDNPNEINDNNTIEVLERLIGLQGLTSNDGSTQIPRAQSLTGELRITANAYNGMNSDIIYNTYADPDRYPNLNLIFEGENAKLYDITVLNGNGTIIWNKKIKANQPITEEFLSSGPKGAYSVDQVIKNSSVSHTYSFRNRWDYGYYDEEEVFQREGSVSGSAPILNSPVQKDLVFIPVFESTIRRFTVTFYNYGENVILEQKECDYNTSLSDILPEEIPYREMNVAGAPLKAVWDFKGYSLTSYGTNVLSGSYKISSNAKLYPIFEQVDDVTKVVHEDWFNYISTYFETDINNYPAGSIRNPISRTQGWVISPKKKLRGKITIPSTHEGLPVVNISDFNNNERVKDVTHIFCAENSNLYEIAGNCFQDHPNLTYFDFSQNTVRVINAYAFQRCKTLKAEDFRLSENLYYLGASAFNQSLSAAGTDPITIHYPSSLVKVGSLGGVTFSQMPNGSSIIVGREDEASRLTLDYADGTTSYNALRKFAVNTGDGFIQAIFYTNKYNHASTFDINGNIYSIDVLFGDLNKVPGHSIEYKTVT